MTIILGVAVISIVTLGLQIWLGEHNVVFHCFRFLSSFVQLGVCCVFYGTLHISVLRELFHLPGTYSVS